MRQLSGVRVTGLLKAHPGPSVDEFVETWFEGHVLPYSMKAFPRLTGLRCNVAIQDELGQAAFDGTQDLWWATHEDMVADLTSPDRDTVSVHVREFVDPIDLPAMREHVYVEDLGTSPSGNGERRPDPTPGLKVVALLKAREVATRDEFDGRLVEDHLDRLTRKLDNVVGLRCAVVEGDLGTGAYDAVEELWWPSREAFDSDVASPVGQAAHENMATFMDSTDVLVREYVFI